ncbi:521_t:CDS:2, partial [Acaulospora colombiana]
MTSVLVPAAYLAVLVVALLVFASRRLEPWFPSHPERDVYVSLLQCDPPAHDGLIKAALVRRAVADVHRIFRLREDKEKELEAEILEVVTEAETFKQGWGNLIFQTAAEIVQNEKLREGMNKAKYGVTKRIIPSIQINPNPPPANGPTPATPTSTVSAKVLQQALPTPATPVTPMTPEDASTPSTPASPV